MDQQPDEYLSTLKALQSSLQKLPKTPDANSVLLVHLQSSTICSTVLKMSEESLRRAERLQGSYADLDGLDQGLGDIKAVTALIFAALPIKAALDGICTRKEIDSCSEYARRDEILRQVAESAGDCTLFFCKKYIATHVMSSRLRRACAPDRSAHAEPAPSPPSVSSDEVFLGKKVTVLGKSKSKIRKYERKIQLGGGSVVESDTDCIVVLDSRSKQSALEKTDGIPVVEKDWVNACVRTSRPNALEDFDVRANMDMQTLSIETAMLAHDVSSTLVRWHRHWPCADMRNMKAGAWKFHKKGKPNGLVFVVAYKTPQAEKLSHAEWQRVLQPNMDQSYAGEQGASVVHMYMRFVTHAADVLRLALALCADDDISQRTGVDSDVVKCILSREVSGKTFCFERMTHKLHLKRRMDLFTLAEEHMNSLKRSRLG